MRREDFWKRAGRRFMRRRLRSCIIAMTICANSGSDAKKAYTHITAAGLRMKDSAMKTVATVQENAGDILASAKDINEKRAAKEAEEKAAAEIADENDEENKEPEE